MYTPSTPHSHPELIAGDPSSVIRVRIILQRLLQLQLALHGCCLAVLLLGVGTLEEAPEGLLLVAGAAQLDVFANVVRLDVRPELRDRLADHGKVHSVGRLSLTGR
jgi:hypothetical protein